MRVNPYIEPLLGNAIDLTNRAPTGPADLLERWCSWGMPVPARPVAADLPPVRRFLGRWAGVVDAPTERHRVQALNELMRRYTAVPSITDHDDTGWHLHFRDPAAGFAATLAGATSASAAQFLCDRGMHRLGRCRLPECRAAFVDLSRPGRQRYCRQPCANRAAVRRHRAAAGPSRRRD